MEYQSMPLLSIKFKIPEPRKNYVSRKKLTDKLKAIVNKKITIIKDGAVRGKTTLLSSFLKENPILNVSWVTLDENMNQVFIFWKYIFEGTKDILGEVDEDFQNWFDGNIQKDNLWQILSMYMNKMYQEKEVIIVLDDFHCITDEFLISTFNFFIQNMPDNLHLVLLTRVMPDFYLGAISMEDNLLLVDEQEIRLTEEESREFLVHTLNTDFDEAKIKTIISNSNGWVGGLQLMAVAAKEQSQTIIPKLNTTNRLIDDYITNEIYQYLSEPEQEFLRKTSILGYFNKEICRRYLPQYDFNQIMSSVLYKNLFVVSIDEEAEVYRYHSIMKDYLISILNKDAEQMKQLHNLAADIYYALGDFEECLNQLFAVKEYEKVMKLLIKMPQTALTFSYMMKVPMEEIIHNIDFAYQYFFCHYASMEVSACERIYHYIIDHMKDEQTISAFLHVDMFFNANWKLNNIAVVTLEQIDTMPLNPVTKAYLLIKEAYLLLIADNYQDALNYLDRAHEIYKQTGNDYLEAFVLAEKTQLLEGRGELKKALNMYQELKKLTEVVPTMKTSYYIGIAGVYIKQLAIDKAREALEAAKASMVYHVENVNSAYIYTMAELDYIIGEHEKTVEIITELAKNEIYQSIYFMARLLRYPIYRGDHKELAIKFVEDYEKAKSIEKSLDTDLLYASIRYENGDENEAMQLTDNLIAKARKIQNRLKIVEGALLKIRMLHNINSSDREVVNILIEAVSYAYENAIALPLWFDRETLINVFDKYQQQISDKLSKEELQFVQDIIKLDNGKGLNISNNREFDLTERELEVLNKMKLGYTNKQIAEDLYISIATVKTHIINIYGKLGVNNRVAAINKLELSYR